MLICYGNVSVLDLASSQPRPCSTLWDTLLEGKYPRVKRFAGAQDHTSHTPLQVRVERIPNMKHVTYYLLVSISFPYIHTRQVGHDEGP